MKPCMRLASIAQLAATFVVMVAPFASVGAADEVNVARFPEWATPNQVAKVEKHYDDAMGVPVKWTSFWSGMAMTEAMVAGEIDIAYSQGLTPFASSVNADAPIKMVAIAVAYEAADDCIVRDDAGIDKNNAQNLEGQQVALPVGSVADYSFRMTMQALEVDVDKVRILDQVPPVAADSLANGEVVMACGYGANSLARMKQAGVPLLTVAAKKAAGIANFDVISVTEEFLQAHPERVRTFIDVTAAANEAFVGEPMQIDVIADDAGLDSETALRQLEGFDFPSIEQQKEEYFGGPALALKWLTYMGEFFATDEQPALDDYSGTIDSQFLY